MKKPRVEKLTLTKFRGCRQSTTFEFAANKGIVLIFGENGTGKSSIADAFDFVCNGELGSLRDRSVTTPAKYLVTLDATPNELEVELRFGGNEWRAALQAQKAKTTPGQPPPAFILRRADIARVMEAQPADRYKALQAYITVSNVERAEGELRQAAKEAKQAVERAVAERGVADEALERFWQAENRPDSSAYVWAQRKTRENTSQLQARIDSGKQVLQRIEQASGAHNRLRSAQTYAGEAESAMQEAEGDLKMAAATLAGQSDVLVTLLDSALHYIREAPAAEQPCPVCGKPEARGVLIARVEQELSGLTQVRALVEMREIREEALSQARGALHAAHAQFVGQCHALAATLAHFDAGVSQNIDLLPLATATTDDDAVTVAAQRLEQLEHFRAALAQSVEEDQKTLNQMSALRSHLATIESADQEMRAKAAVAARLKAMHEIVERERKAYIDRLMGAISQETNALYARVHPDEPLGGSTFNVKKQGTGSLELKAQFGGVTDVVPGAYYSEAHLDTLGLCVYLALAKHSGAGGSIVVFDDILTSVDEPHLERIVELIVDEAPNFGHLIITTHSRFWFDRMRTAKGMNADLFELYGWDFHNGIRHSRTPYHVEELRQIVNAPKLERQAAASKAGILLEQLLDELALRYECRVRRRRNAVYTLGELAEAINGSKAGKSLSVDQTQVDESTKSVSIKPLIDACVDFTWVRNEVGAHFNLAAGHIADSTVRKFAQAALDLADALVCPHCHQLPAKDKSGQYWQCGGGCGKTHLHPLREPAN